MPRIIAARTAADLAPPVHARALLFDWDGTLFDNHHFNFVALRHAMQLHGVEMTEHWFHEHSGFSARGIVAEAFRLADRPVDIDEVLRARDVYADDRVGDISPVAPVLDVLMHPGGRHVGVVTGSNRSNIDALLRRHALEPRLDVLITHDELTHGKPNPEGYELAMRRLGITDPTTVLIYEDSDQGIAAATAAGADVVDVRPLLASVG